MRTHDGPSERKRVQRARRASANEKWAQREPPTGCSLFLFRAFRFRCSNERAITTNGDGTPQRANNQDQDSRRQQSLAGPETSAFASWQARDRQRERERKREVYALPRGKSCGSFAAPLPATPAFVYVLYTSPHLQFSTDVGTVGHANPWTTRTFNTIHARSRSGSGTLQISIDPIKNGVFVYNEWNDSDMFASRRGSFIYNYLRSVSHYITIASVWCLEYLPQTVLLHTNTCKGNFYTVVRVGHLNCNVMSAEFLHCDVPVLFFLASCQTIRSVFVEMCHIAMKNSLWAVVIYVRRNLYTTYNMRHCYSIGYAVYNRSIQGYEVYTMYYTY